MRITDVDNIPAQAGLKFNRSPASFSYKCRELLQQRDLDPDAEYYRTTTKLGAYLFLDRIGVPHARVYAVLRGIDRLRPDQLRSPTVLKPLHGCSAVGVMVLESAADGYHDRLRHQTRTFDQVVERARKARARRDFADVWLLEEPLILDGAVPDDFKFYTFQGDIGLILQRRGRPVRSGILPEYRWYDSEWRPVATGKHTDQINEELEPPADRGVLADMARRVSTASPYAFTRVDTYLTDRGPRVGEVNGWVGGYAKFDDEWDLRLGAAWEAAALRVPTRRRPIPESVTQGAYPLPWWRR